MRKLNATYTTFDPRRILKNNDNKKTKEKNKIKGEEPAN